MTNRRIKFGVFAFLLLGIIVTCGVMISSEFLSQQKEKEDFEQLVKLVTVKNLDAVPAPSGTPAAAEQPGATAALNPDNGEESQEQRRDLSELFAMNDDFVGWLCIPGTDINYPVMHTTDDPERYLRRNFHGEYSESGVPFLDFRCSLDSDNLIIYGHNMMNGTMFAGLRGYVQKDFCEQHPIIEFQTADGCAEYQVFAVVQVKSNDAWYKFVGADTAEDFNKAVGNIADRALFTVGCLPEYGSQLLTLSTCYDSAHNGRLLVIAAKI
ncbi:class B sortase [Acutalibacter caecimuris]|uniref:class B sortase n=1 Tax=Acutalibacter caecimuris TaxID=3093657 RepID=UPI002AC94D2D|nr:class B sortase [Acutalibacter sp. M00118]